MRVAVESILLINFLMDACMLVCAVRPVQRISIPRIFLASALGACASAVITVSGASPVASAVCALLLIPAMLLISCGRSTLRVISGAGASLLAAGAISAALIPVFLSHIPVFAAFASAAVLSYIILARRRHWINSWDVQAEIIFGGKTLRFDALVDTGNRLKEPISGLSVMIVSLRLVESILPEGFDPAAPWRTLPAGFRLVAYGGVGGTGELGCFMPDDMLVTADHRRIRKKNAVWVAVYPGNLPGKTPALAPVSAIQ